MLRQIAARTPNDPFPRYGVAMELRKLGQLEPAREAFAELVQAHPDYVPAYLMFGNLLVELGARAEAAKIFAQGIQAASRAGNMHALGELEGALAALG
jgi:predicted Zn-dependent protease